MTASTQIQKLADLVRRSDSAVALTGAGISVPSGIPDFRSAGSGLWENYSPAEVAHIDAFRRDPALFWRFYGERFASLEDKLPNGAHRALASMQASGLIDAVITQNIDMLHAAAGSGETIEVHGSIATCRCPECGYGVALGHVRELCVQSVDGIPHCERCGAVLKPDVVLFGEMLPRLALERAVELCRSADLLICIGSSLEVHPVASLPELTLAAGGSVAIVTAGPTPLDGRAAVRLEGDVEHELLALAAALELDVL